MKTFLTDELGIPFSTQIVLLKIINHLKSVTFFSFKLQQFILFLGSNFNSVKPNRSIRGEQFKTSFTKLYQKNLKKILWRANFCPVNIQVHDGDPYWTAPPCRQSWHFRIHLPLPVYGHDDLLLSLQNPSWNLQEGQLAELVPTPKRK